MGWQETEKAVCDLLGLSHVGGPGQPDCKGGATVEVKDWAVPMTAPQLVEIIDKEWVDPDKPLIIWSRNGFTVPALELAKRYVDVWLLKAPRQGYSITPANALCWPSRKRCGGCVCDRRGDYVTALEDF